MIDQLHDSGPYNKSVFLSSFDLTVMQIFGIFANQNTWNYFRDGRAVFYNPGLSKLLHTEATLGSYGVPQVPLFIYKAVQDEATDIVGTDDLVARYCRYGANVWYQRNTKGDHTSEWMNGPPRARKFLQQVLDDAYSHEGCTVEEAAVVLVGDAAHSLVVSSSPRHEQFILSSTR